MALVRDTEADCVLGRHSQPLCGTAQLLSVPLAALHVFV